MYFRVVTERNIAQISEQLGLDPVDSFGVLGVNMARHGGMYIVEMHTLDRKIQKLKAERKSELEALWDAPVDVVNLQSYSVGPVEV